MGAREDVLAAYPEATVGPASADGCVMVHVPGRGYVGSGDRQEARAWRSAALALGVEEGAVPAAAGPTEALASRAEVEGALWEALRELAPREALSVALSDYGLAQLLGLLGRLRG